MLQATNCQCSRLGALQFTGFRRQRRNRTAVVSCQAPTDTSVQQNWIASNANKVRVAPLFVGGAGIVTVVLNRIFAGAVGLDASSAESRTDVIVIALSAVLLMTGLQWLALKPVEKESVELTGRDVDYSHPDLPSNVFNELQWAWKSLTKSTRCRSLAVFYNGSGIFHYGKASEEGDIGNAKLGPICQKAMQQSQGNYLPNLALYPGRFEFLEYLPSNTQGLVVQPLGNEGVLIAGSDTQRGFGKLDQAWIALIAEKLSSSLEDFEPSNGNKTSR